MTEEPEYLARLRAAYGHLLVAGRQGEADAVRDAIASFEVAWAAGAVRRNLTDGRYYWGLLPPGETPGV